MNFIKNNKGFTIIEVVLVLAIAGLIFLMVFLALPALQSSQRDTARRSSVSAFTAQVNQYQSNNQGRIPTASAGVACPATPNQSAECFVVNYLKSNWTDPSTNAAYTSVAAATTPGNAGQWRYIPNNVCNGETPTATGASAANFAIQMKLEGSGFLCQDNK